MRGGGAPRKYPLRGEDLNLTKTDKRIKEQNITLSSEVVGKQKAFTIKEILKPFLSSSYDIPKEEYIFRPAQNKKKCAFTLAEVLITLGIIGIVAAMTLPALIANYNKRIICDRLKVAQTTISQMLNFAIADHGDPQYWDFSNVYGAAGGNETAKTMIIALTEKYFIPYLNDLNTSGYKTIGEAGYPVYHKADGSVDAHNLNLLNKYHYVLEFANGMTIFVYMNSTTIPEPMKTHILLYVDVNGKKGPNVFGRDLFMAQITSQTGRFEWYGQSKSRSELIDSCKTKNYDCGALIQSDGWEIKKDYPIKI